MNHHRQYGPRDEQETHEGDGVFLGVNCRLAPEKLPPGMLADAENVRMTEGDVTARLGVVKPGYVNVTAAAVDDGIRPAVVQYGCGVFKDPDGFEWTILAADGGITRCKPHNARFGMGLPTGVKILDNCTFTQAFNRLYCFRGRHLPPLVMTSVDVAWADIVARWDSTATYNAAVTVTEQEAQDIAYGPFAAVTSLTSVADKATVVMPSAHGFVTGADVTVQGANQASYNGRFNITVVDELTFTYQFQATERFAFTVNTGTDVVTATAHLLVTAKALTVTSDDTLPAPLAAGTTYYARVLTANTFTLHPTALDATNNTNIVNLTTAGTGVHTLAYAAYTPATGTTKVSNMSYYWKALGSKVTLTNLTRAGSTATATSASHGFSNGQYVTIAGATPAGYNGTYLISNVATNTFDYTMVADPGASGSGTITAQTSIVRAGQSPDTNPEAWTRRYDILPNADMALAVNNRLLVPTAYTPGDEDYDSTSSYTKVDFIVVTDALDPVHFEFTNELRINQGDDSEIRDLLKYDNDTVIVMKGKRWGILSGMRLGDMSAVTWDGRGQSYGVCGRGAAVVAGKDVYFMSEGRGLVSLKQTEQGLIQSVDVPFSNDIEPWIKRINWNLKDLIRLAWWDNKLYASVPMDDCRVTGNPVATEGAAGSTYFTTVAGLTYVWHGGAAAATLTNGTETLTGAGVFTAQMEYVREQNPAGTVQPYFADCCNAILVHDFCTEKWAGRDTGFAICPKEFYLATYGGRERLFFTAEDGYVNLVEESTAGDQVRDDGAQGALSFAAIATRAVTRGYRHEELMPKKFPYVELCLSVWNARFSLTASTGAARSTRAMVSAKEFSRTVYLRPFDRPPYDVSNVNNDFAEPHRGNYSVELDADGFLCGSTLTLGQHYEVFARWSTRTLSGGYVQFTLTNDQGRCALKAVAPAAQAGHRRMGVLV